MTPFFEITVVKNTLPYIQPYSVIATTRSGNNGCYIEKSHVVGNYKNKAIAEKAKKNFEYLLQNGIIPQEFEDHMRWASNKRTSLDSDGIAHTKTSPQVFNYFQERLKNKDGDQPPELPPSKKRKIIL
jgi:hypothetical protein